MELVELLVRIDCPGCERKVRKQLAKLKGVDRIEIDSRMSKVTVIGYIDRRKVLKAVRKTGKRAEFWQEGLISLKSHYASSYDNSSCNAVSSSSTRPSHMQHHHQAFKRTYNYQKHGYNNSNYKHDLHLENYNEDDDDTFPLFSSYPDSSSYSNVHVQSQSSSMFSDENPHACSIM